MRTAPRHPRSWNGPGQWLTLAGNRRGVASVAHVTHRPSLPPPSTPSRRHSVGANDAVMVGCNGHAIGVRVLHGVGRVEAHCVTSVDRLLVTSTTAPPSSPPSVPGVREHEGASPTRRSPQPTCLNLWSTTTGSLQARFSAGGTLVAVTACQRAPRGGCSLHQSGDAPSHHVTRPSRGAPGARGQTAVGAGDGVVVTAGRDGTVQTWCPTTGTPLGRLTIVDARLADMKRSAADHPTVVLTPHPPPDDPALYMPQPPPHSPATTTSTTTKKSSAPGGVSCGTPPTQAHVRHGWGVNNTLRKRLSPARLLVMTAVLPPTTPRHCTHTPCAAPRRSLRCCGRQHLVGVGGADGALHVLSVAPDGSVSEVATQSGHTDWVSVLEATPDGMLFSGSHDGTVRSWRVDTTTCAATTTTTRHRTHATHAPTTGHGHTSPHTPVRLVCAGTYGTNGNGRWGVSMGGGRGQIVSVGVGDVYVLAGTQGGDVRVWHRHSTKTREEGRQCSPARHGGTTVLRGHTQRVGSVCFLEGAPHRGVSSSADGTVRVWNLATKRCTHVCDGPFGHAGEVSSVVSLAEGVLISTSM
mgnify:CR=1 FL=1